MSTYKTNDKVNWIWTSQEGYCFPHSTAGIVINTTKARVRIAVLNKTTRRIEQRLVKPTSLSERTGTCELDTAMELARVEAVLRDEIAKSIAKELAEMPIEQGGDLHVIASGQYIWTVKERVDGQWVTMHERITMGRLEWLLRGRYYCYRGYGNYDGYYHKSGEE